VVLPSVDMVVAIRTDKLCIRTNTLQVKNRILFPCVAQASHFTIILLSFLAFLVHFLVLSHKFSSSFILLCNFLSIPGIMLYLLYSSQFIF
jgi:hypothetical protein